MAKLYYQGHGSYRLTSSDGRVIYVDPYAGSGYDLPADIILVTHQHPDHNKTGLPARKPDCRIITNRDALAGGRHNVFDVDGIGIEAVEAKSWLHSSKKCVGYILTVDGLQIYAAGDTARTEQMKDFAARHFDYALLPCGGPPNMGLKEASACAALTGAAHNIPIHIKPGRLFDLEKANKWDAPNKLIVEPGNEIELK